MAFSEKIKQEVKKRADFTCCWCQDRLKKVDVHHIVPQAERGPDTIDNAAPLCGSCHDMFGNNPDLRKEIRLRRDHWYERCAGGTAAEVDRELRTGKTWFDPATRMGFRFAPPGTFTMGSPRDEPERQEDEVQHEVIISRGFLIAETVVTQWQWQEVAGNNPSYFEGDRHPVERVSWFDAVAFANLLSERAGFRPCYELVGGNGRRLGEGLEYEEVRILGLELSGYRLPTEAEWEYAARAGTTSPFSFRFGLTREHANYRHNPEEKNRGTVPVRSFEPNPWGLHEVHGNVFDWIWDWYGEYPPGRVSDPIGPDTGPGRVIRGGSWMNEASKCRSAFRGFSSSSSSDALTVGFRLVRTPDRL